MHLVLLALQVIEEATDEFVERFAFRGGEVCHRHVGTDLGAVLFEIAQPGAVFRLGPRIDGTFIQSERAIRNHAVHVEIDGVSEALAARAGARRGVEAEQNRLWRAEFHAAGFALKALVEAQRRRAGGALEDHFAGLAIADFDGVDQTLVEFRPDRKAVHQDEDGFGEIDIQQRFRSGELEEAPALEQAVETFLAQFEEVIAPGVCGGVLAAGKKCIPARPFGLLEKARRHFINRILTDACAAVGAKGLAHAGEQEAQEIEALGGRRYR